MYVCMILLSFLLIKYVWSISDCFNYWGFIECFDTFLSCSQTHFPPNKFWNAFQAYKNQKNV